MFSNVFLLIIHILRSDSTLCGEPANYFKYNILKSIHGGPTNKKLLVENLSLRIRSDILHSLKKYWHLKTFLFLHFILR